ncbi:hypothetical protein BC567DRAFT_56715 [Phyllosticta citribraziliensis]
MCECGRREVVEGTMVVVDGDSPVWVSAFCTFLSRLNTINFISSFPTSSVSLSLLPHHLSSVFCVAARVSSSCGFASGRSSPLKPVRCSLLRRAPRAASFAPLHASHPASTASRRLILRVSLLAYASGSSRFTVSGRITRGIPVFCPCFSSASVS